MEHSSSRLCVRLSNISHNDLDMTVASTVLQFADDTKLYRMVDNCQDGQMLQDDLGSVCDWPDDWKMSFNTDSV